MAAAYTNKEPCGTGNTTPVGVSSCPYFCKCTGNTGTCCVTSQNDDGTKTAQVMNGKVEQIEEDEEEDRRLANHTGTTSGAKDVVLSLASFSLVLTSV